MLLINHLLLIFRLCLGDTCVHDLADYITRAVCCSDVCLLKLLGYEKGVQLVSSAIKCRMHMTRPGKKR